MEMKGISHRYKQNTDEEIMFGKVYALWYHFA